MLLLNILHPLYADDWFYSVIWDYGNTYNSPKISSIGDIIKSQYAHYFGWGGRVVAHILAQFFIMLPPLVFDITNTFVYILFLTFIYKIANTGQKNHNVLLYLLLMVAMWIGQPVFPSTTIWLTGSCNYLWCTFIILLFVYPYCKLYWSTGAETNKISRALFFFLFGLIAGWTNENMSVALLFFVAIVLLLLKRGKQNIPHWAYTGFVGSIVGCAFLLLAPGNKARSISEMGESQLSIFDALPNRFSMLWNTYTSYVLPLTILFLGLIAYKYFVMNDRKDKRFYTIPLLFFATAHVAFFAMVGAPIFPARATFGINTLMILAMGILYANIEFKYKLLKIANLAFVVLAFSYYIYSYLIIYDRIDDMNNIWTAREKIIEESKAKGELDLFFDDLFISHRRLDVYDLHADSTKWQNRSYSTYYGIKSVKRISKDDYKLNLYPQE